MLLALRSVDEPNSTETYPRDRRGYQPRSDLVTALGIFGTGIELRMLPAQDEFTLGSSAACDLCADMRYLALAHARIERIAHCNLRVTNISSGKNDIVRLGEVAEPEFTMSAGDWFEIGESRYVASSEEMQLGRTVAMEVLGFRRYAAIDDLIISSIRDSTRHILLEGESGCDQERLGRAIHRMSRRREQRFIVLPAKPRLNAELYQTIRDAYNGTVLVPLHAKGALNPRVVAALVQPAAKLRLIICARSADKAQGSFPAELVHDAKKIKLPPLRERMGELPELLDRWLIARRSELRTLALPADLRESLQAHTWPGNLAELRETAEHLASLAHSHNESEAVRNSKLSRHALRAWFETMKVKPTLPLLPDPTE